MSYPICRDLQQQKQFFDGVFCCAATTITFSTGGAPRLTAAELVSATYSSVLGVSPALGRLLMIDDDRVARSSAVVVLSYDFWRSNSEAPRYSSGRNVLVNRVPDDGCRGCCAGGSWHRRGRSPICFPQGILGHRAAPVGGLIRDSNVLYGTTNQGGTNDIGTVFSLSR